MKFDGKTDAQAFYFYLVFFFVRGSRGTVFSMKGKWNLKYCYLFKLRQRGFYNLKCRSVGPWKKIPWKTIPYEGNIPGKYIIYQNLCHKAHNSGKGASITPAKELL